MLSQQSVREIEKIVHAIPDSVSDSPAKIAGFINKNIDEPESRALAIFIWITKNILYETDNIFDVQQYKSREESINYVLTYRKGVFYNFALLYVDIARKVGINSYLVPGYTKESPLGYDYSHAWCSIQLDSVWFLVDPTWGAGNIKNGKFIKDVNYYYFKPPPESFIRTHIPFDPMWQLLTFPVSPDEFRIGIRKQKRKQVPYDFNKDLEVFITLSDLDQLITTITRIHRVTNSNSLTDFHLKTLEIKLYNKIKTRNILIYNYAVEYFNEALIYYNSYSRYKKTLYYSENSINNMVKLLENASTLLKKSDVILNSINSEPSSINSFLKLDAAIYNLQKKVKNELLILENWKIK